MNDAFLKACRFEPAPHTPVWFMRQAGRYMPEYRRLREKYSILDIARTPELAAEVTLQPVNRFPVDAAILFADILLPLDPMGCPFSFEKGEGPVIEKPIRTREQVKALAVPEVRDALGFVAKAIGILKRDLRDKIPLIGFAGGPFTIASYMIEGGSSRHFRYCKAFMLQEPQAWHQLLEKVAQVTLAYLSMQIEAGVQAIQLFDSWVGCLSPADYRTYVLPHSKMILKSLADKFPHVPRIHFGVGTSMLLPDMHAAGASVLGIDWQTPLAFAKEKLPQTPLQGNLDPMALFSPQPLLEKSVRHVLNDFGPDKRGLIFNLGHGILPETPVESVEFVVRLVHELTAAKNLMFGEQIYDVGIIGAGISGLSCAYTLQNQKPLTCIVLESSARSGGVIRTDFESNCLLDAGPDSFLTSKPEGMELCRELGLENELIYPRETIAHFVRHDRLAPFPKGSVLGIPTRMLPLFLSRHLPLSLKLGVLQDFFMPVSIPPEEESIGNFYQRHFGKHALELFGEPILGGIYAGRSKEISLASTFPGLREMECRTGSVIRGLREAVKKNPHTGPIFATLRGGLFRLVEKLLEKLPPKTVHYNCAVKQIEPIEEGYRLICDKSSFKVKNLVLATPTPVTARLLNFNPELGQAVDHFPQVSTASIFLGYPRNRIPPLPKGLGFVVPRIEASPLLACTWISQKFTDRSPDDVFLLRCFVGGKGREEHAELSETDLIALARREIRKLMNFRAEPLFSKAYAWKKLTPQYPIQQAQLLRTLTEKMQPYANLQIIGNAFHGIGIPDCIRLGKAAALKILQTCQLKEVGAADNRQF